jgi:hypothetical protein
MANIPLRGTLYSEECWTIMYIYICIYICIYIFLFIYLFMYVPKISKEPETYKNVGHQKKTNFLFGKPGVLILEYFGDSMCVCVTQIHPTSFQDISNVCR